MEIRSTMVMSLKRKHVPYKEIQKLESDKVKLRNEVIGEITGSSVCNILIFGY